MVVHDELKVLKPLDSSIRDDADSWPEFVLRKARVVSQKTGALVEMISARPGHLVTVTGQLEKLDKKMSHFGRSSTSIAASDTICIRDVAAYSFSQYEDESFGFWAAGKAGWYEIRTSAENYKPFYQKMDEAVSMFYFLADRYRKDERVRVSEQYVRSLAQGYVNANYSVRRDADDAREGFYEHRDFLMRSMLEGQEHLDWGPSPILRHFKKQFPGDYQSAVKSVKASGKIVTEGPQEQMEIGSAQQPPKVSARAERLSLRRGNVPDAMDVDDNNGDASSGNATPQHGVNGALRLRSALSSKRFTGPSAPAENQTSDEGTADLDPDGNEFVEWPQEKQPAHEISMVDAVNDDPDAIGLSRFLPQPSYYEPTGPGDTWTCSFDGCNHQIWDARTTKSRGLIEDHFSKKHADEMHELILSEGSGKSSVQHLLSRVQNVRNMDTEAAKLLASTKLPQRVARRY